jgi:hypothetical protein
MDSRNPFMDLLTNPVLIWFAIWGISRLLSGSQRAPTTMGRMADSREIARSVSGWGTRAPRRRGRTPAPTPSPRSHPLWDRELDG